MSWSKLIHLARAKLRGIEAKKRLLSAEGGMLSTQEVASVLDISPQAVHKRRRAGKLIGIAQDSISTPSQLGSSRATTQLLASRGYSMSWVTTIHSCRWFMLNPMTVWMGSDHSTYCMQAGLMRS